MIRLIQRRLIIPRGDTGTFSIPVLAGKDTGDASIFTIFDPLKHTKILEKEMNLAEGILSVDFTHGDTVNLPVGQFVWDIKFYADPERLDGKIVSGTEVDSYYAAFGLPVCEIRETGDNLLVDDSAPGARLAPDQINYVEAAITAIRQDKDAAASSAANADMSAQSAETSASAAAASAQAVEDMRDVVLAARDTASAAADAAASSAADAAAAAAAIHEEIPTAVSQLENDSGYITAAALPTNVSDLVDDSGHYTKPANGIPASDLEETYLTSFTETDPTVPSWAKAAQKPTYTAQEVGALPSDTVIPTVPTNVSAFTNDAGYLTAHQDISGKANSADLAAVALSGDYDDLLNKPTIPEAPVQDVQVNGSSVLSNGTANVPIAGKNDYGVIKVKNADVNEAISNGGSVLLNGVLTYVGSSTPYAFKAGNDQAALVSTGYQHLSTYYGLAKAAGVSAANSEVGNYSAEAKAAIQSMLDVPSNASVTSAISSAIGNIHQFDIQVVQALPSQDIQEHTVYFVPKTGETNDVYDEYIYVNNGWEMIGNTQIDLSNYVQKTDYATSSTTGVVKVGLLSGLSITNGSIKINPANSLNIKPGTNNFMPIVPLVQHIAVFYGLATAAGDTTQSQSENAVGTYTTEAKAAIQSMLGIDLQSIASEVEIPLVETVSGTTPSITGQPNTRYVCGEVSTISITPPSAGSVDVIFESGSTAAVLTVPNTVKWPAWFDATSLETNTTYEILITDGVYGSVMTWAT